MFRENVRKSYEYQEIIQTQFRIRLTFVYGGCIERHSYWSITYIFLDLFWLGNGHLKTNVMNSSLRLGWHTGSTWRRSEPYWCMDSQYGGIYWLQRSVCIISNGTLYTTPASAPEIVLHLSPLDLYCKSLAIKSGRMLLYSGTIWILST